MSFDVATKQIELELHNASRGEAHFSLRAKERKNSFRFYITFEPALNRCAFPSGPIEPGKFDLVYQNADGTESVEYAVSRDSRV